MYEWLEEEIKTVKTNKFFLLHQSMPERNDRQSISDYPLPPTFRLFVEKFGSAKLFRELSYYKIAVFDYFIPCYVDDELFLQFGFFDGENVYFRERDFRANKETPTYEVLSQKFSKVAHSFDEWFLNKYETAKGKIKKSEWKKIQAGPPPFSEEEKRIVEARRLFTWKVVGISESGKIQFEVHNGSTMTLPFLSIGIHSKDRKVNGGAWLPISDVGPGETKIVEKECYKKQISPENVVAFAHKDPEPEDRDRFWEFR